MNNQKNKTALITIDAQEGFHDAYWGNRSNPQCEENIELLLARWRSKKWPVIHVQHASVEDLSPLRANRAGFRLMDFINPKVEEKIIVKSVNSAFIGTRLQDILEDAEISSLVFVGFTTDHCVSTSCRRAANLGFDCTVVSDATATFDRHLSMIESFPADLVHRVSLTSLSGEFAKIKPTSALLK